MACRINRGKTGIERTSSAKPTAAMKNDEPKTAIGIRRSCGLAQIDKPEDTKVAMITAIPAPCGVGT